MNREIKFRAWDNENEYMITSKQGVYTALRNCMDITRQDNSYYTNGELLKPNKEKYILMQFTGLHDKNGKEIYEGDIVYINSEDENAFILWDEETARYIIQFTGWCADFDNFYGKELEVIGNIYENSELLGGE